MSNLEINFTNRETYIAWRADWRETYKELSEEIRKDKHALANAFRANEYSKAASLQRDLIANRTLATRLMELRKEAKEKVIESRAAMKQETAKAA